MSQDIPPELLQKELNERGLFEAEQIEAYIAELEAKSSDPQITAKTREKLEAEIGHCVKLLRGAKTFLNWRSETTQTSETSSTTEEQADNKEETINHNKLTTPKTDIIYKPIMSNTEVDLEQLVTKLADAFKPDTETTFSYTAFEDIDNKIAYSHGQDTAQIQRNLAILQAEARHHKLDYDKAKVHENLTQDADAKAIFKKAQREHLKAQADLQTLIKAYEKRLTEVNTTHKGLKNALDVPTDTKNDKRLNVRDLKEACPFFKKDNNQPDFKRTYRRIMQHGQTQGFTHSMYKEALSIILEGDIQKYYETIDHLDFPTIVADLHSKFVPTNEARVHAQELEKFSRKPGEDLQSCIARFTTTLNHAMIIYPPAQREIRKEIKQEEALFSLASPKALEKLREIKMDSLQSATNLPFTHLLDQAVRQEEIYGDQPLVETPMKMQINAIAAANRPRSTSPHRDHLYNRTELNESLSPSRSLSPTAVKQGIPHDMPHLNKQAHFQVPQLQMPTYEYERNWQQQCTVPWENFYNPF